jgi:proteasome alpha subunit
MDEEGCTVLGGQVDTIAEVLEQRYQRDIGRDAAVKLGAEVLASSDGEPLGAEQLEVAFLDRAKERRAFVRLRGADLDAVLGRG